MFGKTPGNLSYEAKAFAKSPVDSRTLIKEVACQTAQGLAGSGATVNGTLTITYDKDSKTNKAEGTLLVSYGAVTEHSNHPRTPHQFSGFYSAIYETRTARLISESVNLKDVDTVVGPNHNIAKLYISFVDGSIPKPSYLGFKDGSKTPLDCSRSK
jgi:hypothetical protein